VTGDDLTDGEREAVIYALKAEISRDRYAHSPRLAPFRSALAKLDPTSVPKPLPERVALPEAPARKRGGNRARR
jgi:hypothetical protein